MGANNIDLQDLSKYEVLDYLPFGVSIQNRNFQILYENKKMEELLGRHFGKQCYTRWEHLSTYDQSQCDDCPQKVMKTDKKKHKIFRKTLSKHGEEIFLEITHIPILSGSTYDRYLEIVEDVTHDEKTKSLLMEDVYSMEKIHLGFVKFGNTGGEYIISEELNFLKTLVSTFFQQLSIYWFTAIGQGELWPSGFYGPLPCLDYTEYSSLAFPFRLASEGLTDTRLKGKDLVLLMIITPRYNTSLFEKRDALIDFFTSELSSIQGIEELEDGNILETLKGRFLTYIRQINDID
ncbi:MAG: hypothetical protein ACXAB7_08490 [Candidatus Kariarchaeaceae archaeon]|jgi:hypothetical protein